MAVQYCNYDIKGTLNTTGVITAPGGTSTQWNTSYDNMITGLAVTGTTTKTLTATQQDGGTLTASWADDSGSNNYLTSLSFNTGNGILTAARQGLSSVTVDLDGRYALSSVVSGVTSIATTNGITGGTITSTGTLQVDSTVVRTTGNQTVGGSKNFSSTIVGHSVNLTSGNGITTQRGSGTVAYPYAISASQTGLFAASDNANSIFTVNRHPGNYYSQLGFSSNGNLYYRNFVNTAINTTQGWNQLAFTSSIPTVNNGTLTMTTSTGLDGGATFTANQSGNSTFAVTLDLTEISLGAGLDSTATGLTLDLSEFTDMTAAMNTNDEFIVLDSSAERRKRAGEIGLSIFSNDAGFITSSSIPSVGNGTLTVQGTGVLGGSGTFTANQSGNSTISVTHDNSGATAGSYTNANVTVNATGHVTSVSSGSDAEGVTSVATSGTVSGITLTGGTITSTGTITLGGTLSLTSANVTSGLGFTPYNATNPAGYTTNTGTTTASNTQTFTNKSGNISQWTNNSGYITSASLPTVNNPTITITTATGLDGATSFTLNQSSNKTIALSLDLSELTDMTATMTSTDEFIVLDSGAERRKAAGEIGNSIFSNTAGYITSASLPSVGNGTFTVSGSSGLSGVGSMTANQSGNTSATLTNSDKGSSQAIYKNFTASSGGTATANSNNDTLTIAAGTNVTTVRSGDTITINATNDGQGVTSVATGSGISGGTITSTGTLTVGAGNGLSQSSTGLLMSGSYTGDFTATGDITIGGRDLIFSNTGTNDANITSSLGINFIVGSSGTISGLEIDTFGGVTTYNVLTTGGSIIVGGGGIQLNGTGRIEGIDTITASTDAVNKAYVDARDGTMSNWNLTADSGGSMSIGQGTTVDIAGGTNITTSRTGATVQINNSITNNNQLTNGAGYTTNTGTVTGSGATNRVPFWSSSSALSSTAAFTFISNVLYAETAFHVKTGSTLVQYASQGDTDTGLGNFDGNGQLSLLSNNKAVFTAKDDKNTFNAYVSTSVATTGSLNPNQSQQALTSDTLAVLAVDPTGNIVRGSQEGTWTFTKAQLDALTTSTTSGTTLIAAPGANKAIIVEESNLMIKYSGTGTMSSNSFVIRQAHNGDATAEITRLPSGQINTIMSSAPANPSYGFYSRDLPLYNNDGRSFVTNKATFLSRINTNATPTNLVSISIKLKYRMFNASTF